MKKTLFILCILLTQIANAQSGSPKWIEKAKRAVFSVITYDKEDKLLNSGNGFFVTEDGIALSDLSLFKGAQRAVIVNFEGKQMPVESILGVDDMYDVIKFRIAITEKKVPNSKLAGVASVKGAQVYLLPYSTKKENVCVQGKIDEVSPLPGGGSYYTLSLSLKDKMVSCPVMNAEGLLLGLAQKDALGDSTRCYVVGASFAMSLSNGIMFINDANLKNIGIKKALPEVEEQALVSLLMSSSMVTDEQYGELLNDFVAQFPTSTEGYIRRANYYTFTKKDDASLALAEKDLEQALKVSAKKDEVLYDLTKLYYNFQLNKPEKAYKDWGYEKALQEVKKAIALDPLPIYVQMKADIYFALQNYELAFADYDQVNKTNIASAATFYNASKTKELMKGDLKEVIALMDSAVAKFSTPLGAEAAPYLFERAELKVRYEQFKEAVVDYDLYYDVVKADVNDVFYYYREQANYKAKNFKRALDDIQKAVEMSPKDAIYLAELGAVNLRIARYDEAIVNLQDALAIDPQFAACYRLIGYCQLQLGKKSEACANFTKAKELGDEAAIGLMDKHCK